MPKKIDLILDVNESIDYEDDVEDEETDLIDEELPSKCASNDKLPNALSQILIVVKLLGIREYTLSKKGTKKFLNKVRQMQELSQIEKTDDLNYGSRLGKGAEILCKLSALLQLLKIALDVLE